MATDAYIGDLEGIRDIRDNGGAIVPRRNVLNVVGAVVEDNPLTRETVITFRQRFDEELVTILASAQLANTDAAAYLITHSSIAQRLWGLTAPTTGQRRIVRFVNRHASLALRLNHDSSDASAAADRFHVVVGGSYLEIPPGGMSTGVYGSDISRWRVF